jgi:hypothetical protein
VVVVRGRTERGCLRIRLGAVGFPGRFQVALGQRQEPFAAGQRIECGTGDQPVRRVILHREEANRAGSGNA